MQRYLAQRTIRVGQFASSSRSFVSTSYLRAQAATTAEAAQPSASTSPNSRPAPPPPSSTNNSKSVPASTSDNASASSSTGSSNNAKLSSIVDQIETLTLLEASELVSLLKTRLNITEIAMPSAGAAPAAAAAAPAVAVEEEEKPKEKTIFTVKLLGLKDATAKAKVIKEVKALNSQM